jgi:citrate synthase
MDSSQRGFDNQPDQEAYLSAEEACARLGVKRTSLYAYVSRGKIRAVPGVDGRTRQYLASDVERVRAMSAARSGHAAVATGALRWGEPVLDSAITSVGEGGFAYRGQRVLGLVARGATLEEVAELLWAPTQELFWPVGVEAPVWPPRTNSPEDPLWRMIRMMHEISREDPLRFGASPRAELERATRLLHVLAASLVPVKEAGRYPRALAAGRVADAACVALGLEPAEHGRWMDQALVLAADHELNVSTFAARVAASAGADLYACLGAAMLTFTGGRHGGMCDRVEALVGEIGDASRVEEVVAGRLKRGELLPGFGHRLYPAGDPRTPPLLEAARAVALRTDGRPLEVLLRLVEVMDELGQPAPTVDLGFVALALAWELEPGCATALFALGRVTGWIAHILEQRGSDALLRPRARYVGPRPR